MFSFAAFLPVAFCLFAFPQELGMRQIIPEEFVKSRPVKSKVASAKQPGYRIASAKPGAKPGAGAW